MGANITVFNRRRIGGEPAGDLDIRPSELVGTTINASEVPLLVDELPLFALLAVHAHGNSALRGAAELRAKETDRIEAVVDGLRGLGAHIRATPEGFTVRGVPSRIRAGGTFDARGDHRIAMLAAITGLVSREGVEIEARTARRYPSPASTTCSNPFEPPPPRCLLPRSRAPVTRSAVSGTLPPGLRAAVRLEVRRVRFVPARHHRCHRHRRSRAATPQSWQNACRGRRPRGSRHLMIVAIDGPAGAGKSTVARLLAERLGFRYLDTGAMYRALTWLARRRGVALDRAGELAALAVEHPVGFDEEGRVFIDGADVTSSIRKPDIDKLVPVVARHHEVREVMRERQRALGSEGNVVIEGRDIGTVVAPQAQVKVYLIADERIRAARRSTERPGIGADALATDLRLRDERDAINMRPAADAIQIDTTELAVDEVVARIEQIVVAQQPA